MKKRILSICLITLLLASVICLCTACDNDVGELQMNKKYLLKSSVNNELTEQEIVENWSSYTTKTCECYFMFYSDGTGIFVKNDTYSNIHRKYTVHFKYTYVDEDKSAVVCFYDSIEDNSVVISTGKPYEQDFTGWTTLLTVSKNVACSAGTSGYTFYLNEDYAKQLPNLNKTDEVQETA